MMVLSKLLVSCMEGMACHYCSVLLLAIFFFLSPPLSPPLLGLPAVEMERLEERIVLKKTGVLEVRPRQRHEPLEDCPTFKNCRDSQGHFYTEELLR